MRERLTQWPARVDRWLSDAALALLIAVPPLVWLEDWWRAPSALRIGRDVAAEVLNLLFFVIPLIFMLQIAALLVVFVGWLAWLWAKRGVRDWRDERVRAIAGRAAVLATRVVVSLLIAFHWLFVAWQPATAAVLSLLGAVALTRRSWRTAHRRRVMVTLLSVAGASLFAGHVIAENLLAAELPQTRVHADASYHAAIFRNGEAVTLSQRQKRALAFDGVRWQGVPRTVLPQRLAVDPETERVYVTNKSALWQDAVTAWRGAPLQAYALPDCAKPVDLALAPPDRLVVACEFSGTVHVLDLLRERVEATLRVPRFPCAVAVSETHHRAFVASGIWHAHVAAVDLAEPRVLGTRLVGMVNCGIAFDDRHNRLFVARSLQGELLVLDATLQRITRLKSGAGPRKLVIDTARDLLLVGNYFAGTVTAIQLETLETVGRWRVGPRQPIHFLRGVNVAADGDWLAADVTGVWKLRPPPIAANAARGTRQAE